MDVRAAAPELDIDVAVEESVVSTISDGAVVEAAKASARLWLSVETGVPAEFTSTTCTTCR